MDRDTAEVMFKNLRAIRKMVEETRAIVDQEALQVGDRNLLERALTTIDREVEVLSQTVSGLLNDPTKML